MKNAELRLIEGEALESRFVVAAGDVLLGRSKDAEMRLTDGAASREHAAILADSGTFTLEDLQSTNGTFLNGKRIRSAKLEDGDEIRIGRTTFLFVLH